LGQQIKKNDTNGARGTYRGEERCMKSFGGETWKIELEMGG
jgi:hypothetical protein